MQKVAFILPCTNLCTAADVVPSVPLHHFQRERRHATQVRLKSHHGAAEEYVRDRSRILAQCEHHLAPIA